MPVPKCRECKHLGFTERGRKIESGCTNPYIVDLSITVGKSTGIYAKELRTSPKWCPLRKEGGA